jgi:hypothetical protein
MRLTIWFIASTACGMIAVWNFKHHYLYWAMYWMLLSLDARFQHMDKFDG